MKVGSFEIQVKLYEEGRNVKLGEIESSLQMLVNKKMAALIFLVTGAGLSAQAMEKIEEWQLSERVFNYMPLDEEGRKVLSFMCQYADLTGSEEPLPNIIEDVLARLFRNNWQTLLDRIRCLSLGIPIGPTAEPTIEISNPTLPPVGADESIPGDKTGEIIRTDAEAQEEFAPINWPVSWIPLKKEILWLFNFMMERVGRLNGQTTWNYAKDKVPKDTLDDDSVYRAFKLLQKAKTENERRLVQYKGTSLVLTEEVKTLFATTIQEIESDSGGFV